MPSKSKVMALGGVLAVLCIFSLYFAVYLPTNRLFFYGVSSIFCSVVLIESGVKWTWIFYGATSILAFLIVPDKIGLVPYVIFFGVYGIVKYYIEGIRKLPIELALKGIFFITSALVTIVIVKEVFVADIYSKLPLWAIYIGGLLVFYIYDYVYSQFIVYYETKLRKRIK